MTKIGKRSLAVLAAGAMLLTSFNMPFAETESKAAGYGISSPRIEKDVLISGDDSEKPEGTISNPVVKADVTTWDCITFGNYWQEDTNGDGRVDQKDEKQPIKWRVLSVDGDDAFLMAEQVLDEKSYHDTLESITWENCSLRKWLNEDFLKSAFTEEEQTAIVSTEVENEDTEYYGTEGGNNTEDKICLLSANEANNVNYGFENNFSFPWGWGIGKSAVTDTRRANKAWWLRSPGANNYSAQYVGADGSQNGASSGELAIDVTKEHGIRPVLHLNLKTSYWKNTQEATSKSSVSTWDCIYFGKYYENEESVKKSPILWRVLSMDGDHAFVVSDQILDWLKYNDAEEEVTWENATIREWMNETFLSEAFSNEEQEAICNANVKNENNSEYDTDGGNDTIDKVFLLSEKEVTTQAYGFETENKIDAAKIANRTDFADMKDHKMGSTAAWWLRSAGESQKRAMCAYSGVGKYGAIVSTKAGIRPAMYIDLSKAEWDFAGTKCSDGTETVKSSDAVDYEISNPIIDDLSSTAWDCVYFGNYWQNDTNGDGTADKNDNKEPIMWRVLSVNNGEMCLISEQILNRMPFNDNTEENSWKDSSIRTWLNTEFLQDAFSEEEKAGLNQCRTIMKYGSEQEDEKVTLDDVSLLRSTYSKNGVTPAYGFSPGGKSSQAKLTEFAKNVEKKDTTQTTVAASWWLCGLGQNTYAANVDSAGNYNPNGVSVSAVGGVRPVIRIEYGSSAWKYAGRLSFNGIYSEGTFVKAEDIVKPTATPAPTSSPLPTVTPVPTSSPLPTTAIEPTASTKPSSEPPVSSPISSIPPVVSPAPTKAPQVTPTPSVTPTVSPSATATPTITPQPTTTPANTGNQVSQSPQQQPTPQAGENTGTTADTNAKVSLIKQSKVSWKTAKNTKGRKLTASWKKASNADGYQIQYAPNKKFKKAKSKTVKSTAVTLKKLKKKTTYFVRVRAYKAVDGKKVYGKWSGVKKVKIKK